MNPLQLFCWMFFEFTHILQCNGYICLSWTVTDDSLKLKCVTSQIHAQISFNDPKNQEQGFCYIPQPIPECLSYRKNSRIEQGLKRKETVFELRGNISQNDYGQWSCHHGTNFETAFANVRKFNRTVTKSPVYIHLTGPTFIKTRDPVWFTCITNVPTTTKSVGFYLNGIHFITLTKEGKDCYSSLHNNTCPLDECQCSEDGSTYLIMHQGLKSSGLFSVECKAELEFFIEMSDCMMINVIDIDGPTLIKSKHIPFLVSDILELTCIAYINNTNVHLVWECLHFKPYSNFKNTTFINSSLSFQVTSSMKGKMCTCNAIFKTIKTSTTLTIDIKMPLSTTQFYLKDIIWFLSGTVLLVLLFAVFGCLFKHRSRRSDRDIIDIRTTYDTSEPIDSTVHQYDISEPMANYEEINMPRNDYTTCRHNEYEDIDDEEQHEPEHSNQIAHDYAETL